MAKSKAAQTSALSAPQDPKRINVHQRHEVAYWSNKFGVTPTELKNAVKAVGVSSEAVARFLGLSTELPTIEDLKSYLDSLRRAVNEDIKAALKDQTAAILAAVAQEPAASVLTTPQIREIREARLRRARLRA